MTAKEVTVISPRGRHLADYQFNRRVVAGGTYSLIHVPPVDIQALSGQGGVTVQDFSEWLDDRLEYAARAMPAHFIFGTDSHSAQAKLTVSITRVTPGNRALRMLVGEFGIGNARIEVAGRINDIASNEELARFTHRKRSSGAEMPGPGTPFEKLRETGFIVCGDPDFVSEWLANDMRTAGYGHFMGMFRMGKIKHEYVMKSKKLFAEHVMPKLKDINTSAGD